MIFFQTDLCAK